MLACELPARLGLPLSRLSVADLRAEAVERGLVATISETTIWRWLSEDAIRPWTHRSWVFPRDPNFRTLAGRVLDLYAGEWEGHPLGRREFVLCADEKTSIQARVRTHPSAPPGPGQAMRVEHEYARGGALAYLAAWDVHRAKLFGRCAPTTGAEPFARLVQDVMTCEPYASARRVFWVVDNGSSHRGRASVVRLQTRYPNLRLVHLPKHASWLNQIEPGSGVIRFDLMRIQVSKRSRGAPLGVSKMGFRACAMTLPKSLLLHKGGIPTFSHSKARRWRFCRPRSSSGCTESRRIQVEIYFSIVQRKVLTPNDFTGLAEVEHRLLAFQERYERIATPFEWKFGRKDLTRVLARLVEQDVLRPAA